MDNNTDRDLIVDTIYKKSTYAGFNLVSDVALAVGALVLSIIMGTVWYLLGIITLIGGITGIVMLRNIRQRNPRGYIRHVLYHYGVINIRNQPPGEWLNREYHE